MDKQTADKSIYEYRDKIFGFAMEKTRNVDQANELASDIICEVYRSFLRADNIVNPDGYVYRIARNVWAKYVRGLAESRSFENVDNVVIPYYDRRDDDDSEMIEALRREIGYLSDRQRQIVYMHYYRRLSVSEIAKRLDISLGTVKWHLSDARTKLKEGITMTINEQNLELAPIKFDSMGHCGHPGSTGDTNDMFDTRLKQNIAFSCYWQPKTLEEIAREIGVPQVYIADSLEKLVDYAYIDRLDNSKNPKYRANMLITDWSKTGDTDALMDKAAEYLCENFFPGAFRDFESDPAHWGFSCADGDLNFMKYTLVMSGTLLLNNLTDDTDFDKYSVKRPDGGDFIAVASVSSDETSVKDERSPYWTCGYMDRTSSVHTVNGDRELYALSVDCRFADRECGWRDNLTSDWDSLVKFMDGGKGALTPDEYKRLCDKGYVYGDRVQPVIFKADHYDPTVDGSLFKVFARFIEKKFDISKEFRKYAAALDENIYDLMKVGYPEHIRPVAKAVFCTETLGSAMLIPRCIEKLLEKGKLKPLTDIQRKSVFSVLCLSDD
ncbi:MAG: RNA polymerase sigma factor [Oscillospiraceae bacterium]|nr:RNA polymerase sigma factor [Oscillospiraceae bacterium]